MEKQRSTYVMTLCRAYSVAYVADTVAPVWAVLDVWLHLCTLLHNTLSKGLQQRRFNTVYFYCKFGSLLLWFSCAKTRSAN